MLLFRNLFCCTTDSLVIDTHGLGRRRANQYPWLESVRTEKHRDMKASIEGMDHESDAIKSSCFNALSLKLFPLLASGDDAVSCCCAAAAVACAMAASFAAAIAAERSCSVCASDVS